VVREVEGSGPVCPENSEEGSGPRSLLLVLHVVPGVSKSEIVGIQGDALKVRVAAPPSKGQANKELARLLARALGVQTRDVEVVSGHTSRHKRVRVYGADPDAISRLVDGPTNRSE
jgi:uncharacterized protein (TIGR00251 family)